jgi:hypothetical protein
VDKDGYGWFWLARRAQKAHRVAFFLANGRWPTPNCLHSCDNPPCCEPAHLFEGTDAVNMADRDAKGRQRSGSTPANALRGEGASWSKLTATQVLAIRASSASAGALARELGVSKKTVLNVRHGRTWTHI